jgi:antitoxin component of MazEF toxin-antitoxin module
MTKAPVEVKAHIRNDGSIQASGIMAKVSIYKELPSGNFSTTPVLTQQVKVSVATTETAEATFNLADGLNTEFVPETYSDLKAQGYTVPEHFRSMMANVTPRYRIDVEVESDENNNNNLVSKEVRFYIMRSHMSLLVTAENSFKNIKTGTPTKDEIAGRLNYDTLMSGFQKIGWMANPDSNRFDVDVFDRLGWDAKSINHGI